MTDTLVVSLLTPFSFAALAFLSCHVENVAGCFARCFVTEPIVIAPLPNCVDCFKRCFEVEKYDVCVTIEFDLQEVISHCLLLLTAKTARDRLNTCNGTQHYRGPCPRSLAGTVRVVPELAWWVLKPILRFVNVDLFQINIVFDARAGKSDRPKEQLSSNVCLADSSKDSRSLRTCVSHFTHDVFAQFATYTQRAVSVVNSHVQNLDMVVVERVNHITSQALTAKESVGDFDFSYDADGVAVA